MTRGCRLATRWRRPGEKGTLRKRRTRRRHQRAGIRCARAAPPDRVLFASDRTATGPVNFGRPVCCSWSYLRNPTFADFAVRPGAACRNPSPHLPRADVAENKNGSGFATDGHLVVVRCARRDRRVCPQTLLEIGEHPQDRTPDPVLFRGHVGLLFRIAD